MTQVWSKTLSKQAIAMTLVVCMTLPIATMPAHAQLSSIPGRIAGMSTKKKVVVLAGAALLYYLYKKHQASQTAKTTGMSPTATKQGQLYRSKNGGVYYRDAQGKPVWLTVPQGGVRVPASDVQRYAPNYTQYRGAAPAVPAGAQTQSFSQFEHTMPMPRGPVSRM